MLWGLSIGVLFHRKSISCLLKYGSKVVLSTRSCFDFWYRIDRKLQIAQNGKSCSKQKKFFEIRKGAKTWLKKLPRNLWTALSIALFKRQLFWNRLKITAVFAIFLLILVQVINQGSLVLLRGLHRSDWVWNCTCKQMMESLETKVYHSCWSIDSREVVQ